MRDDDIRRNDRALDAEERALDTLMEDAEPCPFCESSSLDIPQESATQKWYVYCDNCGACGPTAHESPRAVALWNVRKQEPEIDPTSL